MSSYHQLNDSSNENSATSNIKTPLTQTIAQNYSTTISDSTTTNTSSSTTSQPTSPALKSTGRRFNAGRQTLPPEWTRTQVLLPSRNNSNSNATRDLPNALASTLTPGSPSSAGGTSSTRHNRANSDFRFVQSTGLNRPLSHLAVPGGGGSSRGTSPLRSILKRDSAHQASRRTLKLLGGHIDQISSSSSSDEDEPTQPLTRSAPRSRADSQVPSAVVPSSVLTEENVRKLSNGSGTLTSPSRKPSSQMSTPPLSRKTSRVVVPIPESSASDSDTSEEEEEIIQRWSTLVKNDREAEQLIAQPPIIADANISSRQPPDGIISSASEVESYSPEPIQTNESAPPPAHLSITVPTTPQVEDDSITQKGTLSLVNVPPTTVIESPRKRFHSRSKSIRKMNGSFRKRSSLRGFTGMPTSEVTPIEEVSVVSQPDEFSHHHHHSSSHGKKFKWRTLIRRLPYYIPCLSWIPNYDRSNLLGDLIAGLTVGVMLVPQGLTYGGLANLPPIFGLYTAFFPLLIYTLMGSSRHLSIGPEVTSTMLIGKTILALPSVPDGDITSPEVSAALISAAMALTFLIGLMSLLLGLVRLGFLDSILSKPMLSGFVSAVAAILICDQVPVLIGLSNCGVHCLPDVMPIKVLAYSISHLDRASWITVLVSFCCCLFMFMFTFFKKRYHSRVLLCTPDILIVVVFSTLASWLLDLSKHGVTTLGDLPTGFITPAMPNLNQGSPSALITGALTITLLGFVETQLINKKYASKHQYTISPNRELVALGCCNLVGSFFGAYTAFGSIPRTKVAETAGVKSQLGNFVAAMVSLIVILWLLPLFSPMPKCVTSSIIFVVACSLIEIEEILFIIRVRKWVDLILLCAMFLMTFLLGVDVGLFFAFGTCLLLAVKQTTLPGVTMLGRGYANDDFHDLSDMDEEATNIEGILIYRVEGALYFANAEKMKDSTKRAETQGGFHVHPADEPQNPMAITSIVFDLSSLTSVDSSALSIFLEIVTSYRARNARVCFVKLRRPLRPAFEAAGILAVIGRENLYRNIERAVNDIQKENLSNLAHIETIDEQSDLSTTVNSTTEGDDLNPSSTPSSTANSNSSVTPLSVAPSFRRRKSMFFAPPVVNSPLLRGLTKMKM